MALTASDIEAVAASYQRAADTSVELLESTADTAEKALVGGAVLKVGGKALQDTKALNAARTASKADDSAAAIGIAKAGTGAADDIGRAGVGLSDDVARTAANEPKRIYSARLTRYVPARWFVSLQLHH